MNELLKVSYDNDRITLSARELHEFLEVSTRYNDWIKRMCGYGFEENIDYKAITQKRVTAQNNETTYIDHQITLDMAKEIAMIQRSDKGKEVRQYFLELERKWNSPEAIMARALQMSNKTIEEIKQRNVELKLENEEMKPKAIFADAVQGSKKSCSVGELAKILKQNGIEVGQNRLFEWLRENGYLIKGGFNKNQPTQYSMNQELMEIKKNVRYDRSGNPIAYAVTRVTGKGQQYFVNKFLKSYGTEFKELDVSLA